jgi:hypothetical protein
MEQPARVQTDFKTNNFSGDYVFELGWHCYTFKRPKYQPDYFQKEW